MLLRKKFVPLQPQKSKTFVGTANDGFVAQLDRATAF